MFLIPGFRDALAFLSRIAPTAAHEPGRLASATPFFPVAGACIGFLAALPTALIPAENTWTAAWLYTAALAWLTRGLHWDGLADIADACGCHAQGDHFWEILKDSRIGTFGVLVLVFAVIAQIAAAHACFSMGRWEFLIVAPAFSRGMVIPFGYLAKPHSRSNLGSMFFPGTRTKAAFFAFFLTLGSCLYFSGVPRFVIAISLTAAALVVLLRLASHHNGANGDFFGALIVIAEISLLTAGGLTIGSV